MSILSNYKNQIQQLNPLEDSKFTYNLSRWNELNEPAKESVVKFANKSISRNHVIKAFESYMKGKTDYLYPFTLTMIWGFADTGYGTYRTNKYLGSKKSVALIKSAFEAIRQGATKEAFAHLMKVDGLSISYVSKILYFATRATKQKEYALIFDIRVARSLVKILDTEGISDLLNIVPSNKYKDFDNYNKLLHKWAKELNVEAEKIEMFLFDGEF